MEHIIERVYRFLLEYIDEKGSLLYLDKIDEMINEDQRSLYVDLQHLESFDPVVVDEIITTPKIGLTSASDALKQVLLGKEPDYLTRMQNRLHLRFMNPPDRIKKSLRKIRSAALGTLISTEAIITKSTEVKPYLEIAAFRCVRCQALQPSIRFTEGEYNPPFACINATNQDDPCTSKSFTLIKDQSTFIDFQRVTLQEKPEELPSGQMPESLTMFLRDDICDLIRPGDRVKVVGVMESRTDAVLTRGKMPLFMKYVEGVSIERETEEFTELEISEEDEQAIKDLATNPNIHRLIRNSIAPIIYGALEEKEAISYLLFGGTSKQASDGTKIRGESNILLIGDPGMGKCVHPETEILLGTGERVKIGDYIDQHITYQNMINDGYFDEIYTEIFSIKSTGKSTTKVSNLIWKRKSPDYLYRITTQSGRSITVTGTHPFFIVQEGLIASIQAKDLNLENMIAVPRKIFIQGSNTLHITFRKSQAINAVRLRVPEEIYPWFANFLGLLLAEGYSSINLSNSANITFTNKDENLLDSYCNALFNLGINYNIREIKGCSEIYCGSSELYYFLEAIDPCLVSRSAGKRVPNCIMKATDEIIAKFLQAFFDGEASVETNSPTIEVASASYNMLKDLQILFLRFEIICQIKEKPVNGKMYYRLRITGKANLKRYYDYVSFTINYKLTNLRNHVENSNSINANLDVIPNLAKHLRTLRTSLNLFQKDFNLPRTAYMHYERGDRYPSRTALQQIVKSYNSKFQLKDYNKLLNRLETLAHSDIYWDKIKTIECIKSDTEWVYDLQVPEIHNFIANNIVVHNSQILKSVADLVPRGLYTSGRGSSAAGLCVAGDSKVFLSQGITEIGPIIESEFECGKYDKHSDGIYFKPNTNPKNQILHSTNLKIQPAEIDRFWKLKSPRKIFSVKLKTGRSIKLTGQTTLLSISSKEGLIWNPASNLEIGNRIATIHRLELPEKSPLPIIEYLKSYEREIRVFNIKKTVKYVIELCTAKLQITKRDLAIKLNISEDNIYYGYINDEIESNISFKTFSELCELLNEPIENYLEFPIKIQIKRGQSLILPEIVDSSWFYILGLLFGDGRVTKSEKGNGSFNYTFGLSNNEQTLIESFNEFFTNLGLKPYISEATSKRPQEIRVGNALLFHIFSYYGLIESPKSSRIKPNEVLLQLEKKFLVAFLQGLYDSDGWVFKRKEGSEGPSQLGYASTSKELIDFIQNALLKYGIISFMRERPPKITTMKDGRKIIGKHFRYELIVNKYSDLVKFNKIIGFKHPNKQSTLSKICENTKKLHSNTDNIPNIYPILSEICSFYNISSKEIFDRKGALSKSNYKSAMSKKKLKRILDSINPNIINHRIKLPDYVRQKIIDTLDKKFDKNELLEILCINKKTYYDYFERKNRNSSYSFRFLNQFFVKLQDKLDKDSKIYLENEIKEILDQEKKIKEKLLLLKHLIQSDLYWDEVKDISLVDSENEYVYDLTVNNSHNFVVNGIIVHNTAAVSRDPDTGEMNLEAGAVVLADKGVAFIDEFDKMRREDRSALHEMMEQHSVSIAKAGIVATLNARTSILAAANPKLGRWDTKKDAIDNLNLPSTIISRFDLIFPIIDTPNRNEDELKAAHILKIHQQIADDIQSDESLNKHLLRKYIAYARKNIHPFLTNEAREEIMKFYLDLREGKGLEPPVTEYDTEQGLAQQTQKPRTIAITPRQLESLIRLSEARAKIALRNEVTREDSVRVIELFKQSLNRVTKGDIDTLYGMSSQKRNKREIVLNVITNLSQGNATPDMDDILRKAREEGMEDADIRDMIDQLLQNGEIYEPRPGTFKKMTD